MKRDDGKRPDFLLLKRRRGSMTGHLERRRMPFERGGIELRGVPDGTGGSGYVFRGYASVFDSPFDMWDGWGDPYTEVVRPGAFSRSLSRRDLDVPFLIGHNDSGLPLARTRSGTMQLQQDSRGLLVEARMDGRSSLVRDLASAVERGDMDEMSIGFVTDPGGQRWSSDYMTREMLSLDLHRGDVSAVALAASPATAGSSMALSSGRPRDRRMPTQPYTAHDGETNECTQCHSVNDDAAHFCDQCGSPMQPVSHVPNMAGTEDMTQMCTGGHWNSADARYCGQCGQELAGHGSGWYGDGRDREQRAADEIIDPGGPPDSNVDVTANGLPDVTCPYAATNGCGQVNSGSNRFCGGCGGPLYSSDGTLVLDDSGVVEARESGADANLLSMRLRMLELT